MRIRDWSSDVCSSDLTIFLAIAKNIVDMHGGTIQVTSDLNGTVFTVRLRTNFDINRENFQMP